MDLDSFNFEHQMDMEISKTSFPYFFENVLGWEFAKHQEEWHELMNSTQRTVIICSRGHGKSVFMHSWVVWNLVFQPPPYQMLYISSNQKQTMVHMRDIDKMFTHPLLKKFKPVRGWAIGNITLTNGNQILERSVGSQIRGLHPTASLRVIGTPFSYTDIYAQLSENEAYTLRTYPCLNALNEPLWPSRWDYDSLMARKAEVGSLMFTREYMCVPISTGTSLFNPEYLDNAKNKDMVLKPMKREGYKYFVGVDPAISTDGDYNVITVLEMDENENKSIVYVDRAKNVEFRENINKVKIIGQMFRPEVIMFETNTFAKSFTQELRQVADLNVHDFNTTRRKKQEIILNLQMTLENGKLNFPYGNEESRRTTSALIEEMSMFAITEKGKFEGVGAHDDMVMSLALANAATYQATDNFILLDDIGIFNDNTRNTMGLNF